MDAFGLLKGKDLLTLFQQLQESNVFLSLRLLGKGYQRITVVTGLRDLKKAPAFCIDYPKGFKKAVDGLEEWRFKFEFTAKDKVQHSFRVTGGTLEGDEIWIPFPEEVERIQRRQFFRIEPPFGSKMLFSIGKVARSMDILNISIGGALGLLVKLRKEELTTSPLKVSNTLDNVTLLFPGEKNERRVAVSRIMVRRLFHDADTGLYRYGIEFTDMDRSEKTSLTKLVYEFQRLILQKR